MPKRCSSFDALLQLLKKLCYSTEGTSLVFAVGSALSAGEIEALVQCAMVEPAVARCGLARFEGLKQREREFRPSLV